MSDVFSRLSQFGKKVLPVTAQVQDKPKYFALAESDYEDDQAIDYTKEAQAIAGNESAIELLLRERDGLIEKVNAYRVCADKGLTGFINDLKLSLTRSTFSLATVRFNLEWFRSLMFSDEAKVIIAQTIVEYGKSIGLTNATMPSLWVSLATNDSDTKRNARFEIN